MVVAYTSKSGWLGGVAISNGNSVDDVLRTVLQEN